MQKDLQRCRIYIWVSNALDLGLGLQLKLKLGLLIARLLIAVRPTNKQDR